MVSPFARVVVSSRQISSELAGEFVILDFESGAYFALDEVGSFVWRLLREPRTLAELRDAVAQDYDVEPARCESDLARLIDELAAAGLVDVEEASRGG